MDDVAELRNLGQETLTLIRYQQFAAAINKIGEIKDKTPNGSENTFCHFVIAKAQLLCGNVKDGLNNLKICLDSLSAALAQSKTPSQIIEVDFHAEAQNLLVGPISNQLREFLKIALSHSTLLQNELLGFSNDSDRRDQKPSLTTAQKEDLANILKNSQLKAIQELLSSFVVISITREFGIRFDFTGKLNRCSQLKILENLQDFNGRDFTLPDNWNDNFAREANFIKALSSEDKGLWCQARAYYTAAFLRTSYKSEHKKLGLFNYDSNGKIVFKSDSNYDVERHYEVLLSLFLNRLISEQEYIKFLEALRETIMDLKSSPENTSASRDRESSEMVEVDLGHGDGRRESDTESASGALNSGELSEDQEEICRTLMDEIETQLLLHKPIFSTEKGINDFFNDGVNGSIQGPKFCLLRKQLLGENYGKDYFESVWYFCWHPKAMRVAAFLLLIPQIVTLIGASLFYLCFYWPYKSNQLKNKDNRTPEQITKDDAELNRKRAIIRDRIFLTLWENDNNPSDPKHQLFEPAESNPESDNRLPPGFRLPETVGRR